MLNDTDLLVFDTHPIQYRSPVFRLLARTLSKFTVIFFDEKFEGNRWWFHEVNKIPKYNWGLPLEDGFENRVLAAPRKNIFSRWLAIRRTIEKARPKAILGYGYFLPENWVVWWEARRNRIPFIFLGETIGRSHSAGRTRIKKLLLPLFFKRVDALISIGQRSRLFYEAYGVKPSQIVDTRYCVNNEFFSAAPEEARLLRAELRNRLGIGPTDPVLLFVGRLFDRKRPRDMLRLHENLQRKLGSIPLHTLIVGNGELESEIRRAASHQRRIHVVGFCNQAETRNYYYAADILIVPSVYETWGLVINEAFSAGLPVACTTDCGAADDLVRPGETGLVFPMGQVEMLADDILQLILKNRLRAMGERAKTVVENEYTVEAMARSILQAFTIATGLKPRDFVPGAEEMTNESPSLFSPTS